MWFNTGTGVDPDAEDLQVLGPTHLSSVDRRTFEAKGATKVDGDVSVDVASLKGTASIGGDVTAGSFDAKGALDVGGRFDAETVSLKGTARVVGSLAAGDLATKGASRLANVAAESFASTGTLSADEVVADEIDVCGVVSADRLAGERVSIGLSGGESTVETIEAETVTVERGSSGGLVETVAEWVQDGEARLIATTIEGETVSIERATVEEVVGREVRIGPGSHVELVRAEEVEVHPDATVERREDYA